MLTAVSDAVWEADLVAATERAALGVSVVRRCVDLADLLATAATGQARAVVLSADLRRLDREALSRLAHDLVVVIGLAPPEDPAAEQRLHQLGIAHVLPANSTAERVSATIIDAVREAGSQQGVPVAWGDPRFVAPEQAVAAQALAGEAGLADLGLGDSGPGDSGPDDSGLDDSGPGNVQRHSPGTGQIIAVWGPQGAPGRTTVAVTLASELAVLGNSTLLVDADVYGGVIAQLLGLLDESPGLAAAARLAGSGSLDLAACTQLARTVAPQLAVLTGIARPDRWLELRPSSLEVVLEQARTLAAFTVVDCGFCLERDEELSFDTAAPRRNGATLAVLEAADLVLVGGSADPVGLQRLIRGLSELGEAVPGVVPVVVVNRLRSSAIPGDAAAQIRAALARYAGIERLVLVPQDTAGVDAAVASGRTLQEAAPSSPARAALVALAAELAGAATPAVRRRRWPARRR